MARSPSGTEPPPAPTHPPAPGGSVPDGDRVFLDACVLYPSLVRSVLLALAHQRVFVPLWSPRVLEEWRRAIARDHGAEGAELVSSSQQNMRDMFPDAEVLPECDGMEFSLPDPADHHVLAGAIAGQASILLTFNLRDFPTRALAPHGLVARHPDSFLWEHFSHAPGPIAHVTMQVLQEFGVAPERSRAALKRARLSRFAKALAEHTLKAT